jgi:predicted ATPase/DNA-binding SARP family transcriptional activator
VQVGILGPLEVRDGSGCLIDIAGTRLRSLLVRMALDPGRAVSAAALVDAVWADQPPADEANALQTLVSRLRRALGDPGRVASSPGGYRLVVERDDVDAHRFEALAADGSASLRTGDAARAASQLKLALALWRGPALAEGGETVQAAAVRLEDLRLAALIDRIAADLLMGGASAVVGELEALTSEHPLDERLTGQLMTALASSGRAAEALAAYEQTRVRLADELGADPSAELQGIHLAVLRGEVAAPTGPQRRTNLRAQLTSFVGRDGEVARIAKSLDEYRLVTLVGPGGAGKTRLAAEAVSRVVDSVPDGVWFVELASVTDGADVAQTVLGSLGLREAHLLDRPQKLTTRDAMTRLLESLADKRAVLVLDNCEHLVEASARLADALLAQCAHLRILTTSREPLGIFGESLLVVPPLGQPERDATADEAFEFAAVRLFADRAAAVRPEFVIDATTVGTVIDIVRRLDGLPLAIELAAARLRSLPITEISERLSDRFRLLTGGSRTALPRHRTLRAVVEWSWDLLSPPEQTLAERFAVFPSGATGDAVTAVCAGGEVAPGEVADLIASLVDKSLLQPVAGGHRVRMLETIREYGTERVAERGELVALRSSHAEYFAQLMSTAEPHLITRDQLEWLALIAAERDNILGALHFWCDIGDADAALNLAVSMSSLAMLLGNHADVATWIAEALAVPGGPAELRAIGEALYAINVATTEVENSSEQIERNLARLADVVTELDGIDVTAHPMGGLMKPAVAMFSNDIERMKLWIDEALAGSHPWVAASVRMFRANIAENNGDIDGMREDTEVALAEFRELGERWGLGSTLRTLAMLRTLDGDLVGAEAAYREALTLMSEMGSREDEAFLRVRMADVAARRGDFLRAYELLDLADASSQASGSAMEAVVTGIVRAEFARVQGDPERARRLYEQTRVRQETIPASHPVREHTDAMMRGLSVSIACSEGRPADAVADAKLAYAASLGTKDFPIVSLVGVSTARLALGLGRPLDAARILGASTVVRGSDDPTDLGIIELRRRLSEELGADAFAAAEAEGRALDREAALARLDPALFTG